MLKEILNLGSTLNKKEQKIINGGDVAMACIHKICEAEGGRCVGEKCVY
ncbi:hypothetical protein [Tenacibaculum sp.]